MTVVMPEPVPLEMPSANVAALDELVREVTLAGYRQEVVGDGLSGPAASAPGWLGADACAAAAQVAAVRELARSCQGALLAAATRLRAHADLLRATRGGVARLRSEQESDFAAAWRRFGSVTNYQPAALTDSPAMLAVADEVRSADQARRHRHTVLIEELAADAAATARVLCESSAVVGGGARPGDTNAVVVALTARLPGWGDQELAALGRALAARLWATPLTAAGLDSSAAGMASFATRPAFAEAFLVALGPAGVRALLRTLGRNLLGPVNSLSRVLATTMAAAARSGPGGPADRVLQARYVVPSAGDGDAVAAGMGVVLLAGSLGPSGLPTGTVAEWARQLMLLEHGRNPSDSVITPIGWGPPLNDPVGLAVGILATRHAIDSCAQLLADPRVWQTALAHTWGDDGAGLAGVVAAAVQAVGAAGDAAVRAGLSVIGDGLPLDDPVRWTVNRVTVGQIRAALGEALAAHLDVALHAMWAAEGGWITDSERAVLRGVGNVSVDCGAMLAIGTAIDVRAMAYVLSSSGRPPSLALPAVLAPAAWVAVQEYGRRLSYALDGYEQKAHAEARAALYQWSYGLLPTLVPSWGAIVAGVAVAYGARAMGADGTWSNGTPGGREVGAGDAITAVAAGSGVTGPVSPSADARVRQVHDRTLRVLGLPVPPASPVIPLWQPLWNELGLNDWDAVHNPKGSRPAGAAHFVPAK